MYLAELHGKLSSRLECKEDILTSNVFSFFKYCNRSIFLKRYLASLGLNISDQEANHAEFLFWQRYEKNTEPDLVIRAGKEYILFEAKYFSDFDCGSDKTKAQLIREIEAGLLEADNYNENFTLLAITADYCYKDFKFSNVPAEYQKYLRWTNWQKIASFLQDSLNADSVSGLERLFASDLYLLLCKKNLRAYRGTDLLSDIKSHLQHHESIFLKAKTTKYRGDFIGFREALTNGTMLLPCAKALFIKRNLFTGFRADIEQTTDPLFFGRKD